MGATERALAVSFFVICFSFGVSLFNEFNIDYYNTQHKTFVSFTASPMFQYSQMNVGLTREEFNNSVNQVTDFKKPENISFNFDFFKSIDIARFLYNILVSTVWGFPFYLNSLGMPSLLVIPTLILMEISHLLVLIYLLLGKSF